MSEIFIGLGANGERQALELSRANRHGLIAGATGTGKTVTLQGLAESFSAEGVPVFVADVKGDLSGIAMPGSPTFKNADKLEERAKELGMTDYAYSDNPAVFWDLYGEQGHPIRTTISEMGPLLLSRLLDLNETQEGVLNVVFRFADEQGLLLLDLEDLQAMLVHAAENASELSAKYGNVTKASVGTIQRCGCSPSCSRCCPRSAIRRSRNWCSSSTRRTSCSTMPPRRCRKRSSRSCA